MFNSIEVANDLWLGVDSSNPPMDSSIPYRGPSSSKPIQPQQTINPRPTGKKKPIALQLYLVTGEWPGMVVEVVLLAENEVEAIKATEKTYGFTVLSCVEVKGPFENGTILMMKQVKK